MTGRQSSAGGICADRPGGKPAIPTVNNARSEPPARRAATTRSRLRDIAAAYNKAPSVIFSAHDPRKCRSGTPGVSGKMTAAPVKAQQKAQRKAAR